MLLGARICVWSNQLMGYMPVIEGGALNLAKIAMDVYTVNNNWSGGNYDYSS